jgi:hypothetical protein
MVTIPLSAVSLDYTPLHEDGKAVQYGNFVLARTLPLY